MIVGEGRHFPAVLLVPDFPALAAALGEPPATTDAARAALVTRADVVARYAALVDGVNEGLAQFEREGFAPFIESWRAADVLRDQRVRVFDSAGEREGVARGIDAHGALQLESSSGQRISLIGGEVSLRREGL